MPPHSSAAFRQPFLCLTVPFSAENVGSVRPVGCQSCFPGPRDCPGDQHLAVLGESTLPCLLADRCPLQSAGEQHTASRVTLGVCCPPEALEQVLTCSANFPWVWGLLRASEPWGCQAGPCAAAGSGCIVLSPPTSRGEGW